MATCALGLWVAPVPLDPGRALLTLLATAVLVGGANALNSYLERDIDACMQRTAKRPLASGRLAPRVALVLGVIAALAALPVLAVAANARAAALGAVAFLSYVGLYTPLKRVSPLALLVGALPGAIPPALGWVAATGRLDAPAGGLFGVLYLWQLVHFLAIAVYRREDYGRGQLPVFPAAYGDRAALALATLTAALLVPASRLLLVALGIIGPVYAWAALLLGVGLLGACLSALVTGDSRRWAQRLSRASLLYLPLLLGALALGAA